MKPTSLLLACVIVASTVHAENAVLYDANPEHPWNRLTAALHSNAPLRFEPPGEYEARVLTGETYSTALKTLDDFLTHHAEKSIKDPVKRAILQNELWATFDQVSDATGDMQAERRQIARRCAALIKRLALSDAEIAALPDTYALTVGEARADTTFLPADLLVDGRPWIMLGASAKEILQPAAIQHVKATQGRAVFHALVRLPEGRQATLTYLKELAEFPQPYAWNEMYKVYPYARSAVQFNPDLPQFPAGTQVALVRRMIAINGNNELVVTRISESIQIRVYIKNPKEAELGDSGNQEFHELRLAPEELFKGNGGLRVSAESQVASHLTFERATVFSQGNNCNNCHGGVGVLSLNTYTHAFGALPNSPWFEPSSVTWQDRNTLNWKKRDYTWGSLSALLQSNQ